MTYPHTFTVWIYRTERDPFGDPVDTTGTAVDGCVLLRHDTSEDRDTGEQITETATLATPVAAEIYASDDVVFPNGDRWHVAGRPHEPTSPFSGWTPRQVVPLRRVTG